MSDEKKPAYGSLVSPRGVKARDVERAADALLREGERPTIEKVRRKIGSGSPNTITPLLDGWWKRVAGRLDAGPAALHRLPETVAHLAEALWLQALEDGRRRAAVEMSAQDRRTAHARETAELRSHVLTLREDELDARLKERERSVAELERQLRQVTLMLRKEQATCAAQLRQLDELRSRSPVRGTRRKAARTQAGGAKTAKKSARTRRHK